MFFELFTKNFINKKKTKMYFTRSTAPCAHWDGIRQEKKRLIAASLSPAQVSQLPCQDCPIVGNCWMCITCGHIGCGRISSGGNKHAVAHADCAGHPLVVKLGTVHHNGRDVVGDVWCYMCHDDVVDYELSQHLEYFGIDASQLSKTTLNVAELEVECNMEQETRTPGQFVIKGQIGSGGFGTVHLAIDLTTGEHVAVKVVDVEGRDELIQSTRSEFELLLRLRHPHVVSVYCFDVDTHNHKASIFMEWLPGGSVTSMMAAADNRLHEVLAKKYVCQALSGLAYLHMQRIVHRDVKPCNMLVALDGTVKLSDFGACWTLSQTGDLIMTNQAVGTCEYMSPEFVRGEVRCANDIWALGGSLLFMVSGLKPWAELGCKTKEPLLLHIGRAKGPPAFPTHISACAADFLQKCFTLDPAARPTAEALLKHPFVVEDDRDIQSSAGPVREEQLSEYLQTRKAIYAAVVTDSERMSCCGGSGGIFTGTYTAATIKPEESPTTVTMARKKDYDPDTA